MSLKRFFSLFLFLKGCVVCPALPFQLFTITTVTNQTCVVTQVTKLKQTLGRRLLREPTFTRSLSQITVRSPHLLTQLRTPLTFSHHLSHLICATV